MNKNYVSFGGGARYSIPKALPFEVKRTYLFEKLQDAGNMRLIEIIGKAGFGKTTFLAQFARQLNTPVAWLSLSPEDAESMELSRHISQAIQHAVPYISLDSYQTAAYLSAPAERLAASLAADLNLASDNLTLILENLEELGEDSSRFLESLINDLGEGHQVILSHRGDVGVNFVRLELAGVAVRYRSELMLFNIDEAEEIALNTGSTLDAEQLMGFSGGWPAALVMAARSPNVTVALDGLIDSTLQQLPKEVRDKLPECAILDEWTEVEADALGLAVPEGWVKTVLLSGIPVTVQGPGVLVPHKTVLSVLEQRLAARPKRYRELSRLAGNRAKQKGAYRRAIQHYRRAEAFEEALNLIMDILPRWRWRSEWHTIQEAFEGIPLHLLNPEAKSILAVALIESNTEKELGESMLREVLTNKRPPGIAFFGLALIFYRQNNFSRAVEFCDQGLAVVEDEAAIVELLRMKSVSMLSSGADFDEARAIAETCLNKAERLGNPALLINATSVRTFFARISKSYDEAVLIGKQAANAAFEAGLTNKALATVNELASSLCILGRHEEMMPFVSRLARTAETSYPLALPWVAELQANYYWRQRQNDTASKFYEVAVNGFREHNIHDQHIETLHAFACHLADIGDHDQAEKRHQDYLAHAHIYNHSRVMEYQAEFQARLFFSQGSADKALAAIKSLSPSDPGQSPGVFRKESSILRLSLVHAWAHYQLGSLERQHILAIRDFLNHHPHASWLLDQYAPDFEELFREAVSRGWCREELEPALLSLEQEPQPESKPTLELRVLGQNKAFLLGRPLAIQGKTFELLSYLALHGEVRRDTLADALWPDKDLRRAAGNLKVHLRHIRAAFQQAYGEGGDLLLVTNRDSKTNLLVDLTIKVDAARLVDAASSPVLLEQRRAVDLYHGNFLPGAMTDWANDWRSKCQEAAATLCVRLAEQEASKHESAKSYYRRAIEIDPLCQEAYEKLVAQFREEGDERSANLVKRTFEFALEQ